MKRWWIFGPALVGLAAILILSIPGVTNPVFYLQFDLGLLVFVIGAGLSLLTGLLLLVQAALERSRHSTIQKTTEERRRFIQRLNHELKNPLTAILVGLANLPGDGLDKDQAASFSSVRNQVNRMRQLVDELRKLSDLETRSLDLGPVDLADLLRVCYDLALDLPGAGDRRFSLVIPQAPWPLPTIQADRDLLTLAVHNLLSNAVKFTSDKDTIELRAFEDGNKVVIEVADTGPGIPDNEADVIWEELYRGQQARGIEGSGLGLSLVKAILSRHQGNIQMKSRVGEGTVFSLHLPSNLSLAEESRT